MQRNVIHTLEDQIGYGKWLLAGLVGLVQAIPELTYFLLWLMLIDTVFGMWAAATQAKLSVRYAWRGATKKLGSLGIIVVAAIINRYVDVLGIDMVQVTTVFYIGPELLSIVRNAAIVGVPVPPQFQNVLRYFESKDTSPQETRK